jgi:hypothetical protein
LLRAVEPGGGPAFGAKTWRRREHRVVDVENHTALETLDRPDYERWPERVRAALDEDGVVLRQQPVKRATTPSVATRVRGEEAQPPARAALPINGVVRHQDIDVAKPVRESIAVLQRAVPRRRAYRTRLAHDRNAQAQRSLGQRQTHPPNETSLRLRIASHGENNRRARIADKHTCRVTVPLLGSTSRLA